MKMSLFIWALSTLGCSSVVFAQSTWVAQDSLVLQLKEEITDFETDFMAENFYFVLNHETLYKRDKKLLDFALHTDRMKIDGLSTDNPLYVSYTNSLFQLFFLDDHLNEISTPVGLFSGYTFDPKLIVPLDGNWLWGYDTLGQQLILWDYQQKKKIQASQNIEPQNETELFLDLQQQGTWLYLFTNERILQLDSFGNIKTSYPFVPFDKAVLRGDWVYYLTDGHLFKKDIKTNVLIPMNFPFVVDGFSVHQNQLFVLRDKVVYLYPTIN